MMNDHRLSSASEEDDKGDNQNTMNMCIDPENHDYDCEGNFNDTLDFENEVESNANQSDNVEASCSNTAGIKTETVMVEAVAQVTSGDLIFSLWSFIKSEQNLMTICNIKSLAILNKLSELMDRYFPQKKKSLLNTRDCIILTTARLKLDISFEALAVSFGNISVRTVGNAFHHTVKKLARILDSVVRRVSKEEIMRNMPKCFEKFQSTTSVLDCTEIYIQKPKCLKCRIKFYSHYKGQTTVKFMTEVTPAGIITSISDSFGGRASDKSIFNHTGTLKHLESARNAIMVDKGFLVDDQCAQKRIKLIRPPFLRKKKQLSQEEAVLNREIASARVHIERMNQRIFCRNII